MRILLWRTAAFGDVVITTPLIRHLHSQGHEIIYVTGDRGFEVLKNNPHVHKLLRNDESVKNEDLGKHMEWLKKKHNCDRIIDLNESIECALSQHPRSPNYKLPKQERIARFNRNFYEYCFEHAGEKFQAYEGNDPIPLPGMTHEEKKIYIDQSRYRPELFFDKDEKYQVYIDKDKNGKEIYEQHTASEYIKNDKFNVLVGLSGSGANKAYPWMMDLCNSIMSDYPDVHIITVGDVRCQLLENPINDWNITKLAGNIPMRMSMELTSMVNLVISPDTGLMHAAGCYDTPKICLLGHNTIECITKHFKNDYSIESNPDLAPCSPCLYMIYNINLQCPLNLVTRSSVCMADGLPLQVVYDRFQEVHSLVKL